jgi:hypothetical protein
MSQDSILPVGYNLDWSLLQEEQAALFLNLKVKKTLYRFGFVENINQSCAL